jgi:hypothetical protein
MLEFSEFVEQEGSGERRDVEDAENHPEAILAQSNALPWDGIASLEILPNPLPQQECQTRRTENKEPDHRVWRLLARL